MSIVERLRLIRSSDHVFDQAVEGAMQAAAEIQPDRSDPTFLSTNIDRVTNFAKRCREEETWFAGEIARLTQEMQHRRISAEAFELALERMSDGQE